MVTGPPGTGKSQVVISLLANLAWQGGSVLFSSKNNHAVDVVETRANELGPYPMLLRLGKEEHHVRLAQHLTSSMAESVAAGRCRGICVAHSRPRRSTRAIHSRPERNCGGGGAAQSSG